MQPDKQPENQSELERMRHTASHVLAQAVLKFYPDAKLGIGPAIENGFYYDFEFAKPIADEDLPKIEKEMKRIIKLDLPLKQEFKPRQGAIDRFHSLEQKYKLELLEGIPDEELSFFITGDNQFIDLCRGPHIESTGKIGAVKLQRLAGAYWKGDEKNQMLTRIYGLAFKTNKELEDYLEMLKEAEKRDHRVVGPQLGLFMFHETAPGMPYWLPKGLILYNELVNYWRQVHMQHRYEEIASPLINKKALYDTSGHWEHYKDNMFISDMGENEVYALKPMNCPNAMIVFQSRQVSYKDLPLRLSDTDRLHRYELSGTLNGLLRARSFQQDDSHNFISEEMIGSEYDHVIQLCDEFYGIFGLQYSFRLGTRPEDFMGDIESWSKAEAALKEVLEKSGKPYYIQEGDGAFYGPKIDILMKDALGREWQMGTIQLDYQLPKNFGLTFTDKDGQKKMPVVVHRVIYGSLERFIGLIVEHFGGAFPLWISPEQVRILPISEKQVEYAQKLNAQMVGKNIRSSVDNRNERLQYKIRDAEVNKVPYVVVVGDREVETKTIALRIRGLKDQGMHKAEEFINHITESIATKRLDLVVVSKRKPK